MPASARGVRTLCAILSAMMLTAGCGSDEPPLPEMPRFDENRAWNYLGTQVTFGPRVAGHRPHDRQLRWMQDQLGWLADEVTVQQFRHTAGGQREVQFTNVLARWRPDAPERVLLVTHWDTRLFADRDTSEARRAYPVPGANDGASGTAVLMELAQLFRQQPPPVGVDLLFTDGSDVGRDSMVTGLGARHYVASLQPGQQPRYAIWVDRVGDLQLRIPREPGSSREVVDRVWSIARRMGRDSVFVDQAGPAVIGDHRVFAEAGVPVAAIVDPEFGPDNRLWRTRSDQIANTHRRSLALVGEVLAAVVYSEAQVP